MALSTADIQAVYSLLSNALSTDDSIRKPAELSLSQCESRPGFCSCLFVSALASIAYYTLPFMNSLFPLSVSGLMTDFLMDD